MNATFLHYANSRYVITTLFFFGFVTDVSAACYPPENQLPPQQVQNFLQDPPGLLRQRGGLTGEVLKLVASDSSTLPAVVNLLDSATPQQKSAIGAGLAAAVQACLVPDQAFAGEIQSKLAEKADRIALTAFVSGGGQDNATTAIGFAGAPSETAFVSGSGQGTGNTNINNTPLVIQPTPTPGGFATSLTFTPGAGPNGRLRNSVSP